MAEGDGMSGKRKVAAVGALAAAMAGGAALNSCTQQGPEEAVPAGWRVFGDPKNEERDHVRKLLGGDIEGQKILDKTPLSELSKTIFIPKDGTTIAKRLKDQEVALRKIAQDRVNVAKDLQDHCTPDSNKSQNFTNPVFPASFTPAKLEALTDDEFNKVRVTQPATALLPEAKKQQTTAEKHERSILNENLNRFIDQAREKDCKTQKPAVKIDNGAKPVTPAQPARAVSGGGIATGYTTTVKAPITEKPIQPANITINNYKCEANGSLDSCNHWANRTSVPLGTHVEGVSVHKADEVER